MKICRKKNCSQWKNVCRARWPIILIFVFFAFASANEVGNKNRKANKLYSQEKYEDALKLYEDALQIDPTDGKLKMNRGSALYQLNEFDEAEQSYLDALGAISSKDKKTIADAHYNLGNIRYKQGERLEAKGDAALARGKYSQALEDYINTLKLRPNDKDAKWNLQLAHQKVDMLENQQEEEQNQDGGDDQNKDDSGGQDEKKDDSQKNDQSKDQSGDDQNEDLQDQEQQSQDQKEQDMKKDEAERLIEQYADDADTLNKPKFQRGKIRQPEKDW